MQLEIEFKIKDQVYIIINNGTIFSKQKNRLLKLHDNSKGYLHIKLWDGDKTVHKYIHRLVATFFIPNPYNLPEVNHLDGNKANCNDWNLKWCTHAENMAHAHRTGLFIQGEINKQKNQKTWIGQKNSTRIIVGLTKEKNKAGNYKVLVRCNCGNEMLMYHNDFKKDKASNCRRCRPKSSYVK